MDRVDIISFGAFVLLSVALVFIIGLKSYSSSSKEKAIENKCGHQAEYEVTEL